MELIRYLHHFKWEKWGQQRFNYLIFEETLSNTWECMQQISWWILMAMALHYYSLKKKREKQFFFSWIYNRNKLSSNFYWFYTGFHYAGFQNSKNQTVSMNKTQQSTISGHCNQNTQMMGASILKNNFSPLQNCHDNLLFLYIL